MAPGCHVYKAGDFDTSPILDSSRASKTLDRTKILHVISVIVDPKVRCRTSHAPVISRTPGDEKRFDRARLFGFNIVRTIENEIAA
jgi:hypothetical protein